MQTRDIFLAFLRAQFSEKGLTSQEKEGIAQATEDTWKEFLTRCEMHKVQGVIFRTWKQNPDLAMPEQVVVYLKQKANGISIRYYQMISCIKQIIKLLEEQEIPYYLLKGAGLSTMYPMEEMRSFGDVDLYIPRAEDLERAKKIFTDRNCEVVDTFSDCHTVYSYKGNGANCEVEVHWKLTADFNNGDIDQKLEDIYKEADGTEYAVAKPLRTSVRILPPTLNALHLLAHMLQHFMSAGFGLKLFCDWTAFWQTYGTQVDTEKFMGWIRTLRLERFLYAVTGICIKYLGLSEEDCSWFAALPADESLIEALLEDVWTGGEHGKYEEGRMVITSRQPGLKTYFLELHRQMKRRFKKARDWVILWPILWVLTGICFVYNNLTLRKISTKKIMDTNKKRNRLVQKLDVFEKNK